MGKQLIKIDDVEQEEWHDSDKENKMPVKNLGSNDTRVFHCYNSTTKSDTKVFHFNI